MGNIVANVMTKIAGAAPRSRTPQRRKRKGEFDWRTEDPGAFRRRHYLKIEAFVRHFASLDLHEGITRAHLIGIYVEWLETNDARPVDGWIRWDKALRSCGVTRRRSSLPGRPRLYFAPIALPAPALAKATQTHKGKRREAT